MPSTYSKTVVREIPQGYEITLDVHPVRVRYVKWDKAPEGIHPLETGWMLDSVETIDEEICYGYLDTMLDMWKNFGNHKEQGLK